MQTKSPQTESPLTIRLIVSGMIPDRNEAVRLLKTWGIIFVFCLLLGEPRSGGRGVPDSLQNLAFIATEAAICTAILDFGSVAMRD